MSRTLRAKVARRLHMIPSLLYQKVRIAAYKIISTNKVAGNGLRIVQPVHSLGRGKISIGVNVTIGVFPSPSYLSGYCYIDARSESAEILIGDDTTVNNAFTAIAETTRIEIGRRCLIGPHVTIFDSDFHGLALADRMDPEAIIRKPVKIGDDVFIGAGAVILKGVRVGSGAVIGAGAVVVSDIPENMVAAGNPARVLRAL